MSVSTTRALYLVSPEAEEVMGGTGGEETQGAGSETKETPEEEEEERAEEAVIARPARNPGAPSAAERAAHEATHLPFRIWCPVCVRGRRDNPPRTSVDSGAHEVPEVLLDYCFIRRSEESSL